MEGEVEEGSRFALQSLHAGLLLLYALGDHGQLRRDLRERRGAVCCRLELRLQVAVLTSTSEMDEGCRRTPMAVGEEGTHLHHIAGRDSAHLAQQ